MANPGQESSIAGAQPLIRKLTTEKAIKAHRQQQTGGKGGRSTEISIAGDDITNIKLSGRGIKSIESLDLPSLRCATMA